MSEDCLFLNIYRPRPVKENRAVMVNIHVENCYLQVENHSKIFCLQVFYLAVCPESSVIQDLIFNCIVSYNYNCFVLIQF